MYKFDDYFGCYIFESSLNVKYYTDIHELLICDKEDSRRIFLNINESFSLRHAQYLFNNYIRQL